MRVIPIPAFDDNYIWLFRHHGHTAVVDPGDETPVLEWLDEHGGTLDLILLTHHHYDHTGGVQALVEATGARVYGPQDTRIPCCHNPVRPPEDRWIAVQADKLSLQALSVPGHTVPHLAWKLDQHVFCGDTLFSLGCGRLFDGTASQLHHSLCRLAGLPDDTLLYPTHEYTLDNLRFARHVLPEDAELNRYGQQLEHRRKVGPTLPVRLADERRCNPFLRCHQARVQQAIQQLSGQPVSNAQQCFTLLRQLKDRFRG